MTTLYLTEPYSTVRKEGETLVVKMPENKETGTPAASSARAHAEGRPGGGDGRQHGDDAGAAGAAGTERRHLFLRLSGAVSRDGWRRR